MIPFSVFYIMEMELSRVDYTLVGITAPQTMKLLPSTGTGMTQKVTVADQDGVLQVFSVKKGDIQIGFKTLPSAGISRLELGGALGTVKDKIFVSSENEVRGYTKKGKLFLGFDTNLTEHIKSMHVSGSNLLVCGKHAYNQYHDCKDTNSYLCGDEINDVISLSAEKNNRLTPVLACEDRTLRVLDRSSLLHNIEVDAIPTVLHLNGNEGGETGDEILYGTADGRVGLVCIGRTEVNHRWILNDGKHRGGILCMDCYDMSGDGVLDLLIGRQDGTLDIFSLGDDAGDGKLTQRFSYSCNESITSIHGGVVGNAGYEEVVASTYTGFVFGMVSSRTGVCCTRSTFTPLSDISERLENLRMEIDEIEQRVNREREKYQAATQDKVDGLSAIPFIAINDKMTLCREDASYSLVLEVQTPIDNVLIQSDVPVDLLDVERNSAVVSYSACEPASGNYLLATYRCQMNTTRLELKLRTIEGQHGTLRTYVTPLVQPKCCQVRQYKIKPLSLHIRCHSFDHQRPYNILTLKGAFSLGEIHTWVSFCLPEIPEKVPTGDKVTFTFVSTFLDTVLHCSYSKGEAEFKSDNISTISILKDILTKEATKKKIKLDLLCAVNDESVVHTLQLLHPKLKVQLALSKQVSLLEALRELETHDAESLECLLPEYKQILKNEKELLTQYKRQPAHLDRLYGMITDLYIDRHKFKGINVKGKVPQLIEILDKYDLQNLLDFFQQQSV
ncbi:Bardet-Biedl syndrome 7 protein homolog isoform X2 [Zootermopsis nevadensis]|uniref:Bardet-Biedl syndrome 7 protein homolog n=1 Tax=Zootermopsis nevadensis TaxID=136037 RepID=A0A067QWM4_ZOONE|nr:Bardet-Biedl syndrome 7 protein homolog isoform X2 [Zootermopsis nevadensis]KDR14735.1 Bardet-Biedl syndrome 7 protein-like protein [Zootermopsis nevadensis]